MSTRPIPQYLALAAVLLFAGASRAQTGRLVFSTSPIDLANPQSLTTSFKADDPIYAAALLTAPPKTLCQGRGSSMATKEFVELKLTVDNSTRNNSVMTVKGPIYAEAKSFSLDVAPEPSRMTAYKDANLAYRESGPVMDGAMIWSRELGSLASGTHRIKIDVKLCYVTAATGEFTIQGASFDHYAQLVARLKDEQTKGVGMSAPKMRDRAVEDSILTAIKASASQAWKDQILRVVIIDSDWYIERHPISGAILFRYVRAEVAVKAADGKCSFYRLCTFKQNYMGGKFGPTFSDGRGDRIPIVCENVSK